MNKVEDIFGIKIIENPYLPEGWMAMQSSRDIILSNGEVMIKIPTYWDILGGNNG